MCVCVRACVCACVCVVGGVGMAPAWLRGVGCAIGVAVDCVRIAGIGCTWCTPTTLAVHGGTPPSRHACILRRMTE